jgi:hypothetical protein
MKPHLPFSIVKHDYPFKTVDCINILKHQVGTSDGQFSLEHYSHWAQSYIHQNNHALHHLFCLSSGYIECKDNVKDGLGPILHPSEQSCITSPLLPVQWIHGVQGQCKGWFDLATHFDYYLI